MMATHEAADTPEAPEPAEHMPEDSGSDWPMEPWGDVPDLPRLPWLHELA